MANNNTMTNQEIEGLLFNAQQGDAFTGLTQSEAKRFQEVGFANRVFVEIAPDKTAKEDEHNIPTITRNNRTVRAYSATVRY